MNLSRGRRSRLDVLHKPFARYFPAQPLFFRSFVGAVAHGGKLHAGADVVEKESYLVVVGAAWSLAGDEIADLGYFDQSRGFSRRTPGMSSMMPGGW